MAEMEYISVKTRQLKNDIYELTIEGALDWSNYAKVESALEEIFGKGVYHIVVNLANAQYISSAGFGCFIQSMDTAMSNGGKVIFAGTPAHIKEVFNILGLSQVLTFADSADQALQLMK